MSDAQAFAEAAERLIGTPFRLHGRDPEFGLDCVGLVAVAMRAIGREPITPEGYCLANRRIDHWLALAETGGWRTTLCETNPGDLVLVHPAPTRSHLLICGPKDNFIHAHAGLRRVVSTPSPLAWKIARQWRLADT